MIEGIHTEGTRTVTVIEAGKIGNERPIEIVSEKWYSPERRAGSPRHEDAGKMPAVPECGRYEVARPMPKCHNSNPER